ncbi:MAG: M42 family metallopeptidase [Lentisphaerae bacterium]|nr:M42 family metallopeptidase [Lentisphaerota bacterium]
MTALPCGINNLQRAVRAAQCGGLKHMRKQSLEFLRQLLNTPSPSGSEPRAQRLWCDYVRDFADEVVTDPHGNATAIVNPRGNPKLMLDAHMDEIGMIIKYIDDKGFLYVQRIGGVDPALVAGKRVWIHTGKGPVAGVVGCTPIHLQDRTTEKKTPKLHELYVDIGATSRKTAERRVSIGDALTFADEFQMLTDDTAVARGMDNRCGAWVVAEALRMAKERSPKCAIYACSSIQEEVGCIGATMQAQRIKPDAAIVVDVTFSTDTPGIDVKQFGEVKLGGGPTISIGRENHPVLVDRIRKVARKNKIPHQIETFHVAGGTDAQAIYVQNGGVPCCLVGLPNRYMHSTVETVCLKDLQHASELLACMATDIKTGERFAVKI